MAHKSVIVIQKAGKNINPAYLSRVFKEYNSYMGAALVADGKLMVAKNGEAPPNQAAVTEITDAFGGTADIVFTFCKADKNILEEDMQPFELLKDEDGKTTLMAGFLDGGFQGYTIPKSSHTDEFHCAQDFLIPKMKKLHKYGNGLPGLLAELADPITAKDFQNAWTDKGNITLIASEGSPITFSSNNTQKTVFNWGWTSNSLGYVEQTEVPKVEKPAEVVAEKPLSMLEKLKLKASGAVTGPAPKPADLPAEAKTDTSGKAAAVLAEYEQDYEYITLPAEAKDWVNKKKVEWWTAEVGYKPDGYRDLKLKIKRKKGSKLGVLHALAVTNTKENSPPADTGSVITKEEIATEANTAPEPTLVKDIYAKHVSSENLPLVTPVMKKKIQTEWMKNAEVLKVLGEDHREMFDPKLLQHFEETYAGFMDGLGLGNLEETAAWNFNMFSELAKVEPQALAVLAFNLRNEMLKTKLLIPGNKIITANVKEKQKAAM